MAVREIVALLLIAVCLTRRQYRTKSNSSFWSKSTLGRKIQIELVTISSLWIFEQEKGLFLGQQAYSAITMLLLRAGDVETCPGPGFKYC